MSPARRHDPLDPCPACGSSAEFDKTPAGDVFARCTGRQCGLFSSGCFSPTLAAAEWRRLCQAHKKAKAR